MAQAMRGEEEGQAQLIKESDTQNHPHDVDTSKLVGQISHDQLCDAMHEEILATKETWRRISSMALQEKGRSQSNPNLQRG